MHVTFLIANSLDFSLVLFGRSLCRGTALDLFMGPSLINRCT